MVEPAFKPPQAWHFDPEILTVHVGTKLTWENDGAVVHTVTADAGPAPASGDIPAKGEFSFTPTTPGTITYHCAYHPWMKGVILILP
jgi:plastocyanin